ncbi:MAG: SET domain-containing protein [Gammaproteobacteria bacterium]|nr:SET domain-containing protein [Gammaproteobacteria bacterium]
MIKFTYVAPSRIHGKGLFSSVMIPEGSTIGWLTGKPCAEDGDYVLWISEDRAIEVFCDLKYINHSDHPNACYYDDLSVIALCDIEPNEEITHDYNSDDW